MTEQQRVALLGIYTFLVGYPFMSTPEKESVRKHHIKMLKEAFPDIFNNLTPSN